jgi:hypothetical protein
VRAILADRGLKLPRAYRQPPGHDWIADAAAR